jgi:hypothetical protein
MADMVLYSAKRSNHGEWLDLKVAQQIERARVVAVSEQNEKIEFVARMKAARETKRKASAANTNSTMEVSHG